MLDQLRTILSELCGGELCGDPERLLGTALEDEAGGDAGAAVEVFFTAGQAQVQGVVTEGGVLITLKPKGRGGQRRTFYHQRLKNNLSLTLYQQETPATSQISKTKQKTNIRRLCVGHSCHGLIMVV